MIGRYSCQSSDLRGRKMDEEVDGEGEMGEIADDGGMEPSIVSRSLENAVTHNLAPFRGGNQLS